MSNHQIHISPVPDPRRSRAPLSVVDAATPAKRQRLSIRRSGLILPMYLERKMKKIGVRRKEKLPKDFEILRVEGH